MAVNADLSESRRLCAIGKRDDSPDHRSSLVKSNVAGIDKGSALSLETLLPDMTAFDFSRVTTFRTPILIFANRHDNTTPSKNVAAWLTRVQAPSKKIVWFENSAHMMSAEEPGRVLVHLVEDVRPLASRDLPAVR